MNRVIAMTFVLVLWGMYPAMAQFAKGTIMVGGSISGEFDTNKEKNGNTVTTDGTTNTFTFVPQAGYFVLDNFALGAGIGLISSTFSRKLDSYKYTSTSTTFSPFARYYYHKFFGQGSVSFGSGSDKQTEPNGIVTKSSTTVSGFNLGAGYAILLNEHVAIEPQVGYSNMATKNKGASDKNIIDGLYLQIGFQIYLNR